MGSVRRLVTYEHYSLLFLARAGVRVAAVHGVVELTPNREYMLVTEFFENARNLGDSEIDDTVIDEGLLLVRQLWDAGVAHRDIKPANLLVRDGHLQLVDVSALEVRPSPWRQAVDLANMMMTLAVRTDAERVYERASRVFTQDEIAEGVRIDRRTDDPHRASGQDEGRRAAAPRTVPGARAAARSGLDPAMERPPPRADGHDDLRDARGDRPVRRRPPSGDRVTSTTSNAAAGSPAPLALPPIRFFSSARDASRARRPTDAVLLLTGAVFIWLASLARGPSDLSRAIGEFVAAIPGLFGWFWELSYDGALLWALALVVAAVAGRRPGLVRDQFLAAGIALGLSALVSGDVEATLHSVLDSDGAVDYPGVRLALVVALLSTSAPHLALPIRRVGRWLLVLCALGGIAIGVALPTGVMAGVAIGWVSAALVHLVFGSPGGVPTLAQVGAALSELGIEAVALQPAELGSRGVALIRATDGDGRSLLVKVYGRDARDGLLLSTVWATLWYRDDTSRLALSRRDQVEREGFVTLLAERATVPVAPVLSAGVASNGDALVVLEMPGTPLWRAEPETITDEDLQALWHALDRLHTSRITHGRIDGNRLVVHGPSASITDLVEAQISATPSLMLADEVQLLVAEAIAVGSIRAIQATSEAIGADRLGTLLPYLQAPVLPATSRRRLREAGMKLDDFREEVAAAANAEIPKLEHVRRVTWGSFLTAALLLLGAYVLITGIAGLGIEEILDELEGASSGWVAAALVIAPIVQVGQAFGAMGASPKPVLFGPVLMLQFAIQFLALAVPSAASRIAMNIRFFRGVGLTPTEAVAVGAVDSFAGFVIEALIVLIVLVSGTASLELGIELDIDLNPRAVALLTLAVAIALLALLAISKVRTLVRARVADATSVLRGLRSPSRLLLILGGNLGSRLVLAVVLGFTLRAFGDHAPLGELLLVNTLVSLLSGVVPIPGGIGVSEAATTAGLVALGVPEATALATAIVFRLVTFYIPPIWGVAATRRLRRAGYL